jgi:IS5 family transposase
MPAELEAVDRLLDDPAFFEPFRAHFHCVLGRPSVPIETYLRLMFLKFRYRLGFEPLCREVADSISWQRFCRIPLGVAAPHPTTLMKITTRCGTSAIDGLNEALLAKAVDAKVLKTNKLRADTTVVPANVAYPTDSGLLAKGVAKMAKAVKSLQAKGLASRTATRDRTRMMRSRARAIGANLRRRSGEAKDEVMAINAEMAALAATAVKEARRVAANARRTLRSLGAGAPAKLERIARDLEVTASRVERIAAQTRQRIGGTTPDGATRLVSLHDPDARPIRKGRLGKPVEFGYNA